MKKRKTNNTPLDEDLKIWYQTNNVIFEKNELYYDFFSALFDLVDSTYLGEDVMNNEETNSGHFKWCYNKIIENFKKENIIFASDGPLYDYLWFFFNESYYKKTTDSNLESIMDFFNTLFDFTKMKPSKEMETYKFLYKLFEMALKN